MIDWWCHCVLTIIAIEFILYSSAPLHDYATSYIIDKNKKAEVYVSLKNNSTEDIVETLSVLWRQGQDK